MDYRISVDRNLCIACGVAPIICPQVFKLGDNGKNMLTEEYSEVTSENVSRGMVPENLARARTYL